MRACMKSGRARIEMWLRIRLLSTCFSACASAEVFIWGVECYVYRGAFVYVGTLICACFECNRYRYFILHH